MFDMTARGDSQSHAEYARRMFGWNADATLDRPSDRQPRETSGTRSARGATAASFAAAAAA